MIFKTMGNKNDPAILFFHAMGVTGDSSEPAAEFLKDRYYCIMPTSTVYCAGQEYAGRDDEVRQIDGFLHKEGIGKLALINASSIGADLAMAFLTQSDVTADHVFFDGGQFAQINGLLRAVMTPFLYLAMKSIYWSKGRTLKKILWCDDESIRPYFIEAGRNLTYRNLRRQMKDSLQDRPFPELSEEMQKHIYWEFGSIEDHFRYRENIMQTYRYGNFPVFMDLDHMQYQIRDPEGYAEMLEAIVSEGRMPDLPFMKL